MNPLRATLERDLFYPDCCLGKLSLNGVFECYTLEDQVRPDGVKVHGETAIGYGTYTVDLTWSPRFSTILPLLVNVKGFVGVRIHPGNTAKDTEGCILVGSSRGTKRLNDSRLAFKHLFLRLKEAKAAGAPILLTITPALQPPK